MDYKNIISNAANHIHGDTRISLNYQEFKDIIIRCFGEENKDGTTYITSEKMNQIVTSILGVNGTVAYNSSPYMGGKLSWFYDLKLNDGFLKEN